jgi:chromosome segregation ATPase
MESLQEIVKSLTLGADAVKEEVVKLNAQNATQELRITNLESQVNALTLHDTEQANMMLTAANTALKCSVEDLASKNSTLENDYSTLQTENTTLKSSIENIKADMEKKSAKVTELEDFNKGLESENERLSSGISTLKPEHKKMLDEAEERRKNEVDPGNQPTLVELLGITEYVQDLETGLRRLYASKGEFFLYEKDGQGRDTMAYFEKDDIAWRDRENDDYEITFKKARRYGDGMIGVPPPFGVSVRHCFWVDKHLCLEEDDGGR